MIDPTDDTDEDRIAAGLVLAEVREALAQKRQVEITFVADRELKMNLGTDKTYCGGSSLYIISLKEGLQDLAKDPANDVLLFVTEFGKKIPLSQATQF